MLSSFTILKSLYPTGQPAYLEKMTLVQGKGYPIQRVWASKAPTSSSSHKSDNKDHKNPLRSNKPPIGPPKASSTRPLKVPEIDVVCYTPKKTYNKSFNWSFRLKHQKDNYLEIYSKPSPLTSIMVGLI